jgi:predicted HAD superfamily Cof-like phosphohydrolase
MEIDNKIKTNFNKVMEFNRAFDMVSQEPEDYTFYVKDSNGDITINPFKYIREDIFKDSPAIIKLRLDLIKEELDELFDAIDQNDMIEQRDACSDILYVVYGMADVLGIDIDGVFNNNIKHNIDYYINNKLAFEFNNKSSLNENNENNENNNYYGNNYNLNSNINIEQISNFNKIKMVTNNILGFNINSKTTVELIILIKDKLKTSYIQLENNSINDSKYDYKNMAEKFEIIANNLYVLLKWTYIMSLVINTNADKDFAIVHDSNMSKLCATEEDAINTVQDYKIKYNASQSPYDSPYYYYLPKLNKWIVKNLSTGKALKNIKYKKVCFTNPRFVF